MTRRPGRRGEPPLIRFLVSAGLAALALSGCKGSAAGGNGAVGSSDAGIPRHYSGRLMREVVLQLPPGYLAALSSSDRTALETESGGKLDVAQNALVYAPVPFQGRYIKAGSDFVLTNSDGYFHIADVPASMTTIEIYREIVDGNADAVFPLDPAGFDTPSDLAAARYVKKDVLPPPGDMNPPPAGAPPLHQHGGTGDPEGLTGLADGCGTRCNATAASVVSNQTGCCADYDGSLGDGLPRARSDPSLKCVAKAYTNFIGSTCEKWSDSRIGTACQNESAYQCKIYSNSAECSGSKPTCRSSGDCTPGATCLGGACGYPNCFQNHKFRNCQNMDPTAFKVQPSPLVTVASGGQVTIGVGNNTEANQTRITGLNGVNGKLALTSKGPSMSAGQSPVISHYDSTQHYAAAILNYTAPQNPRCTPLPVLLTFDGANPTPTGTMTASLTILVKGAGRSLRWQDGSAADSCPVDLPSPSGALGDVLTLSGVVAEWAKGDAIAPGTGSLTGIMVVGPNLDQLVYGIGSGAVDTDGSFGFIADCTGGGGPCASSVQPGAALCPGLSISDPRVRMVKLDTYFVDSLYVDGVHARVGGGLIAALEPPRNFIRTGRGDVFTYMWVDRPASIKGSCGPISYDLTLARGWNSLHRNQGGLFRAENIPPQARWYFFNTLTAG